MVGNIKDDYRYTDLISQYFAKLSYIENLFA